MNKLDGRAALVSGSGRGIGLAIAMKLASKGARVVSRGYTPEEAADAICLFCVPETSCVTGQVLVCGGGRP